jgi:hypothetical protein
LLDHSRIQLREGTNIFFVGKCERYALNLCGARQNQSMLAREK